MGNQKNNTSPGDEEISPLKKLIHKKNEENKAFKKLLKALEIAYMNELDQTKRRSSYLL